MTNDSDSIATLRLLAKCGSMDLSMLGPIADEIAQLRAAVKTAQELAARRLMEIERLKAEVNGLPKARKCMASATSDPPQDCDAPFCGCDPAWSACIEMLQECNLLVSRPAHEPSEQRPADGTRDGDGVWQGGLWHPDPPDPLDEWRLMEFAPKDGTRILALVTEVQFYRDTETPNELIPAVVKWTGEYSGWGMPGHGGLRPTLWLPIKLTNDPQGASRDAPGEQPPTDKMRLDWWEAQHTLHNSLHLLYVVDGYDLEVIVDDRTVACYHGEDIRACIDAAMKGASRDASSVEVIDLRNVDFQPPF